MGEDKKIELEVNKTYLIDIGESPTRPIIKPIKVLAFSTSKAYVCYRFEEAMITSVASVTSIWSPVDELTVRDSYTNALGA